MRPLGVEITSELRSLSSLALSRSALMKVPGRYAMRSMRPAAGLRFTWQLNTLMKIDTRGSGASPRPSSAGGSTCVTIEMRPSAGATTMPSRTGVTRTGSRKNSAHQTVSSVPIQPSGGQIQNRIRLTRAKPPMNG